MSYELKAKLTKIIANDRSGCKIIRNYFLFFSIILLNCSRYAFKEIIFIKLHPIQKLLRIQSNFEHPQNKKFQINFQKIK